MTDPNTILQILGIALGLVRKVKESEGAERAFDELERMTSIMGAVNTGLISSLDVTQARVEIDHLAEKLIKQDALKKGEADADAALLAKFAHPKEKP